MKKQTLSFCNTLLKHVESTIESNFQDSPVLISKYLPQAGGAKENVDKQAAVFIPLCNRNGEAAILFNVRSKNVGTHKGDVCFPGGHLNHGETAIEAATRETLEEFGNNIGGLHTLAVCQTIPSKTGMPVTPVLGWLDMDVGDLDHFEPNEHEVDHIFSRTISELLDPKFRTTELLPRGPNRGNVRMPVYGAHTGDERIWGLTALILQGVMANVIEPAVENHYNSANMCGYIINSNGNM